MERVSGEKGGTSVTLLTIKINLKKKEMKERRYERLPEGGRKQGWGIWLQNS